MLAIAPDTTWSERGHGVSAHGDAVGCQLDYMRMWYSVRAARFVGLFGRGAGGQCHAVSWTRQRDVRACPAFTLTSKGFVDTLPPLIHWKSRGRLQGHSDLPAAYSPVPLSWQ